jgi:predicted ATP-dependent serine protease
MRRFKRAECIRCNREMPLEDGDLCVRCSEWNTLEMERQAEQLEESLHLSGEAYEEYLNEQDELYDNRE